MCIHDELATALGLLGMFPAAPVAGQARALPPGPVTAFVHVAVIPMDRERVLADYTVLVQGDRITALGPASRVPVPDSAVRIDGRGQYLLPGLADMHVHFASGGRQRWNLNPTVAVADMLFTFVANGVTTVRDMHSGPGDDGDQWMPRLRQRIATGELLGPRIYAAGDPDESSPAAAARSVVALKAAGYDFVKLYGSPVPVYDSIVAAAHRVGLPVAGHVPYAVGIRRVFDDHWASIEHLLGYLEEAQGLTEFWGGADSAHQAALQHPVPDAALRRLAQETQRAGVWNCPTLAFGELVMPFYAGRLPPDARAVSMVFYPRLVKALQAAGAGLLLGTDADFDSGINGGGAFLWSGFAIHRELASLVAAGLTPYQALATGTNNVARFLHTADSTGTVAVGKRADLVLLKGNPLVDIRQTAALAGVMVGGRWLSRAELEERIDTLGSGPKQAAQATADAGAEAEEEERWGTPAVQLRLLKRLLWR